MYKQLNSGDTDMKFTLRNQSFKCHQIVFKQNAYMQAAIDEVNAENMQRCGEKL